MVTRIETATDSKRLHVEKLRKGVIAQSTTTGAMTKVPAASASHQVTQVTTKSEKTGSLARMNPATAMVELIIVVGAKEMIANLAIQEGLANVWGPLDQRLISHVPANAASRTLVPTEPNSRSDRPAMRWGERDPTKIAGQIR